MEEVVPVAHSLTASLSNELRANRHMYSETAIIRSAGIIEFVEYDLVDDDDGNF